MSKIFVRLMFNESITLRLQLFLWKVRLILRDKCKNKIKALDGRVFVNEQQNKEEWYEEELSEEELYNEQKIRERRAKRIQQMKKEKARCIFIQKCIKIGVPIAAVLLAAIITIAWGRSDLKEDDSTLMKEGNVKLAEASLQQEQTNKLYQNQSKEDNTNGQGNAAVQNSANGQADIAAQNQANIQDNAAAQNRANGQADIAAQNQATGQDNAATQNHATGQNNAATQNHVQKDTDLENGVNVQIDTNRRSDANAKNEADIQNHTDVQNNTGTHNNSSIKQEKENEQVIYSATATKDTLALGSEIVSTNALLIDLEGGNILAQKDMNTVISPASMTKVLTVLVAAEQIEKAQLEDTFTMTLEITDYAYVNDCSSVGFLDGEVITVRDLFYGTILPSGGDAAVGLATYVAGSHEAFVELMNEKLEELGLSETAHVTNCVGLYDKEHHCTVYDMAMIMEAAMENDICREVMNAHTYTTSATTQHPEGITISNWFLRRIEDKDTGGEVLCAKTGYVVQSGSCAVSYAKDNGGKEYVCVTANATSSWKCIYDHVALYKMFATGEQ